MPYDERGRWIPPTESSAWSNEDSLVNALRLSGDLGERGRLEDLFDVGKDEWESQDWESELTERERFEVLDLYRQDYESGRGFEEDWGIQFEREQGGRDLDLEGLTAQERYRRLLGDGYDIDYAHYNQNLAYRAAWAEIAPSPFGIASVGMKMPFSSARQIRAAKAVLEQPGFDYDEAWVRNNAMPYDDQESQALEDFAKHNQTRHFDPKTNITTYLGAQDNRSLGTKLYEARQAGNYTQLKEPGPPQFLNVVAGEVPEAVYNSEGTRMVGDGDVRAMYTRYLGRDHAKLVDTNIDPDDPAHDPTAIGRDEINYWESQARVNNWTHDDLLGAIKGSAEASRNVDRGELYYNPNAGKESEIRNKLTAEPEPINPPDLTIRKIKLQRPDNIPSNWAVPGVT